MKNNSQRQIYSVLLISIFVTSCNGQIKTNVSNSDNKTKATTNGQQILPGSKSIKLHSIIGQGLQDKSGNLWFVSNGEGVYCYNGKLFTNFTIKDGLDTNIVYSILEDKTGVIWLGTCKGLNRYDGKTFIQIPLLTQKLSFPYQASGFEPALQNKVWSIIQDSKGTIWVGSDAGVYCYNPGKQKNESIYFVPFLDNNNIGNPDNLQLKATFSILEDKAGSIWFGTCVDEGISRFDGRKLVNIAPQKDVGRVNRMVENKDGNIWFTTTINSVCRYDGKTFTKNFFKIKEGNYDYIINDKSGSIWFDIKDGIGYYNGKSLKVFTEKNGFPGNNIAPILIDKSGNIWFFAEWLGLYSYDGKVFTKFSE